MRQFATTAALAAALFAGAAAHPLGLATTDHTTHKPKQTVVAKAPAEKPTTPATPAPVIVTVAPGDTLSSIAAAEQTTYVRIFDANTQITDPNVIDVGWQLRIPTADEQPECVVQSTRDALALPRPRAWAPRDPDPEDGWMTVTAPEAARELAREQQLAQLGKRRRSRAKSAAAHRVPPDQLPLW